VFVEPGQLIASGRDGDIFEYGPGLVLRKTRDGRSIEREAHIMQYVAEHGYPVPRIDDVRAEGTEIVMERIDGPLMMDAMVKGPRKLGAGARTLADLADQLHAIAAPDWLRVLDDDGQSVLHMDLHPLYVIMSARGPIVIDWGNACRGRPLSDIGCTYALLLGPRMPGPWVVRTLVQPVRALIGRTFTSRYHGPELEAAIVQMARLKTLDAHMYPDEVARLERIAHRHERRAPG
jgi:aminoglycoside phosphotransferase (APT) family kinase protein